MKEKQQDQEKLMKMQLLSQQLQELQKYMENIEKQMLEVNHLKSSLDEFKAVKPTENILAPLANGIFIKAKLIESKTLLVNVGNNVVVEKTVTETKSLLDGQMQELERFRLETITQFNEIAESLESLQQELKPA